MTPTTYRAYVILDCDGKPLGVNEPWIIISKSYANDLARHFSNSRVQAVRVTIEEASDERAN